MSRADLSGMRVELLQVNVKKKKIEAFSSTWYAVSSVGHSNFWFCLVENVFSPIKRLKQKRTDKISMNITLKLLEKWKYYYLLFCSWLSTPPPPPPHTHTHIHASLHALSCPPHPITTHTHTHTLAWFKLPHPHPITTHTHTHTAHVSDVLFCLLYRCGCITYGTLTGLLTGLQHAGSGEVRDQDPWQRGDGGRWTGRSLCWRIKPCGCKSAAQGACTGRVSWELNTLTPAMMVGGFASQPGICSCGCCILNEF